MEVVGGDAGIEAPALASIIIEIMEPLFGGRDGKLRAVSGKDGREIWSIAVSGQPNVADVDGDGWVEVLAVGADGVLRAIGE